MIKPMFVVAAMMFAMPTLAQEAAPAAALPMCSAKVTDGCQQTQGQEARAMSGAQADARDAKTGSWTPDATTKVAMAAPARKKAHHKAHKKMVTTTTTTETAPK